MKVRPRMSVMSQLSDIQALAKFGDVERLTLLANYCKEVLMDYEDLDVYVEEEELNKIYRRVVEYSKK